jgi:hypothetical protein
MGAADMILLTLLTFADVCLLIHLHRRRQRRMNMNRMMRALRSAIRREVVVTTVPVRANATLVLQRAS